MKKSLMILLVLSIVAMLVAACGGEEEEVVKPEQTYPHGCEEYVQVRFVESVPERDVYEFQLSGNYMLHYLQVGDGEIVAYPGDVVRIQASGSIYMGQVGGQAYYGSPDLHLFIKYGMMVIPQLIGRFYELVIISFPFDIPREIVLYILEAPGWFLCTKQTESWYANNVGDFTVEITIQHYEPENSG